MMFAFNRLRLEFRDYQQNPNEYMFTVANLPDPNNIFNWRVIVPGPVDTPYAGGLFYLTLRFPENYPNSAPKVIFDTPIYHVNVRSFREETRLVGEPDLEILIFWKPEYLVKDIIISVYSLFYMNKVNSSFSANVAEELRFNKTLYEEKARYFTRKFADPDLGYKTYSNWDFNYQH